MTPRTLGFVSFWITLSLAGAAHAWGDLGHETVAMIAEDNLSADAKAFVEKILGPEPLSIAAIWPDQVREDRTNYLPFAAYHLCDVANPADIEKLGKADSKERDCYSVLTKGPELLKDPSVSQQAKIIIMRYLIHVAGDVHQPLHIGNGLDLGGNLCDVRLESSRGAGKKANLHSTWDTAFVEGLRRQTELRLKPRGYFGSSQLATAIQNNHEVIMKGRSKVIIMNQEPLVWLRESSEIRQKRVYPDSLIGMNITDDRQRPYCKYIEFDGRIKVTRDQNYKPSMIPLLTKEYQEQAQSTIEMQLLKAGLRLAGLLNRTAPKMDKTESVHSPVKEVLEKMKNTEPTNPTAGEAK